MDPKVTIDFQLEIFLLNKENDHVHKYIPYE